ncbi:DUF2207 domain-containing protein [Salinactinospora qingdaonensis]
MRPTIVAGLGLLSVAGLATGAAAQSSAAPPLEESPAPPAAHAEPGGHGNGSGIDNAIELVLEKSGVLRARETISFGADPPERFTRTFVTREPYDDGHDRLWEMNHIAASTGDGATVETTTTEHEQTLDVELLTDSAEQVILEYEVRGSTSRIGDRVEMEWVAVGGYSAAVSETTVTVTADAPPLALSCAAGDPRSSIYCASSDMGSHQALIARFMQTDMAPGHMLSIVVGYPPGTAPDAPILARTWSLTSAFAITPLTGSVFGLLLLVLVGGLVLLIRVRGRDERALRTEAKAGDTAPLSNAEHGGLRFRPPDDVHPGQIGTLVDEQADVVDITASVVDLGVRGHLAIEELPHERSSSFDWLLTRLPSPPEDPLMRYERLLLDALFHAGDEVRLSQLSEGFALRLAGVRDELYRDMVRLKWFARRPNLERNRWTSMGIALTGVGVVATVLLAIFTYAAFTGLAVIIAGAAVTVGAQSMPAKTKLGSAVFAHTLGFRTYLLRTNGEDVPADRRVAVLSRYLPYAIIFDDVDRWAQLLARAGSAPAEGDELVWYRGPRDWHIDDFADSIKTFTLTLSGVISNTRQFKTLSYLS